jgi:hypothetical protein
MSVRAHLLAVQLPEDAFPDCEALVGFAVCRCSAQPPRDERGCGEQARAEQQR